MKLIKKISYYSLLPFINLFFKYWQLSEQNMKNKENFLYLEKKNEYFFPNNNNYVIHNFEKKFKFQKFKTLKLPKYYYYMSKNNYGLSASNYPVFFDKYFRVYLDSINLNIKYLLSSSIIKHIISIIFNFKNKNTIENVVSFSGSLSDNKFHFIIDYLPRLQNLIDNDKINNYIFILPKNNMKFNEYYLRTLGVSKKNIFIWKGEKIFIKNLHIYSLRYLNYLKNRYQVYTPSSIRWLQTLFKNKFSHINKNSKFEKIFVLRKKNDSRSILNINDIKNLSILSNFRFIYLEDFSEKYLVEIFKSVKVLITVHGASLTNMIFSNNLKIIEIYPKDRPEEDAFVYYQLSRILNFEHHVYMCNTKSNKNDLEIDVENFEKLILKILE